MASLRFLRGAVAALAASAALTVPPQAGAQAPIDTFKRVSDRGWINVGFNEEAPPFSLRSRAGAAPVGYAIDLCLAIVRKVGQQVGRPQLPTHFLPVSTDQVLRVVGSGGVELMCAGTSDTAERRESMLFSAPIFISSVKLLVRKADAGAGIAQLKGRTVTVMGRTTAEPAVKAFSDRHGLALRVARAAGADAALGQLRLGHAQAWARDEVLLVGFLSTQADRAEFALLPHPLSEEVIAIAMPRDAALQQLVDRTLAAMARSGELQALYWKWFVGPNEVSREGLALPLAPQLHAAFERLRADAGR